MKSSDITRPLRKYRLPNYTRRKYSSLIDADRRFRFLISPAYCAKTRYIPPDTPIHEQLYYSSDHDIADSFSSAQKMRPDAGDDAYFYSTWTKPGPLAGSVALGVADGVGGLAKQGIDPSHLSNSLLEEAGHIWSLMQNDPHRTICSPVSLLRSSYDALKARKDMFLGATTACIATANSSTGMLVTANLGDSGFYVFRQGRLLIHSKPQIINFNTPYQLRILPDNYLPKQLAGRKILPVQSAPEESDVEHIQLQHGDFVLFASDGLSDNLYLHDILKCVTADMIGNSNWVINETLNRIDPAPISPKGLKPPAPTVRQLVSMALNISTDPNYPSPFAANVRRMLDIVSLGGKPDDITVLAFLVEELPKDVPRHHNG